ncbi:MAG: VOC family protein [Parvularculaceae bacterium]|nr:VOC family protein [Parvularculaceae bacterium]
MTTMPYVIRFVADMASATRFFQDDLGLTLRFQSPDWTEFDTGSTTLALHAATAEGRPGACQLGLKVDDLDAFHARMTSKGFVFTRAPTLEHGRKIARFRDRDGAEISVSE